MTRMSDHRLPKSLLFGWLPQFHPRCGPKKRWRDIIRKDLKDIHISKTERYREARKSRVEWKALGQHGLANYCKSTVTEASLGVYEIECVVCSRRFRRENDRRHKCIEENQKHISEQRGAAQHQTCHSWFRSRGSPQMQARDLLQ